MWLALTCGVLGGLLATYMVAWGLAAFSAVPMYPRDTIRAFVANGRVHHSAEVHKSGFVDVWWGVERAVSQNPKGDADAILAQSREPRLGSPLTRTIEQPPSWGTLKSPTPGLSAIGSDTAFGWPLPCLWYQVTGELSQNEAGNWKVDGDELHGGLLIRGNASSRGRSFRALPLRPIVLALVLNAVALGTPICVLLLGLRWFW
jgi:hypothetical protein